MRKLFISILMIMVCSTASATELRKNFVCDEVSGDCAGITASDNIQVSLEELHTDVSSNSNAQLNVTPFHSDGTEGVLITGTNYVAGKSGIDASTEAIETIDYEHHETHSGTHYHVSNVQLVDTTTFQWQVTTSASTAYSHMIFAVDGTGEVEMTVTEGSDRVDGGALVEINRNRIGTPNVANTIITTTPTGGATDGAVELLMHRSGSTGVSGKTITGGGTRGANEFILKPSTKYIVSVETFDTIYVTIDLDWYEHTDKN
jgi:hypothetical protein